MLLEAVENLPVVGSRQKKPTNETSLHKETDRPPWEIHMHFVCVCCERHSGGMLRGAIPRSVKYVTDDPGQISKNVAQP